MFKVLNEHAKTYDKSIVIQFTETTNLNHWLSVNTVNKVN